MSNRASRMFLRPLPYVVHWLDGDRYRSITTYERTTADKVYDDLRAAGNRPTMWQGEMVVRDDLAPRAVAFS